MLFILWRTWRFLLRSSAVCISFSILLFSSWVICSFCFRAPILACRLEIYIFLNSISARWAFFSDCGVNSFSSKTLAPVFFWSTIFNKWSMRTFFWWCNLDSLWATSFGLFGLGKLYCVNRLVLITLCFWFYLLATYQLFKLPLNIWKSIFLFATNSS